MYVWLYPYTLIQSYQGKINCLFQWDRERKLGLYQEIRTCKDVLFSHGGMWLCRDFIISEPITVFPHHQQRLIFKFSIYKSGSVLKVSPLWALPCGLPFSMWMGSGKESKDKNNSKWIKVCVTIVHFLIQHCSCLACFSTLTLSLSSAICHRVWCEYFRSCVRVADILLKQSVYLQGILFC